MAGRDPDFTIAGWLGTHPKLYPGKGEHPVPYTQFRIGHTSRQVDRTTGEVTDGPTSWYTVKSFRELALNVAESLRQGDPVVVHGMLRIEDWEGAEGRSGSSAVVYADAIGPDLRWGSTRFSRTGREAPRSPEVEEAELAEAIALHAVPGREPDDEAEDVPAVPLAAGA